MKILLTIAVLDSYHGSVMHVLELSNYLSHKHEVSVVTPISQNTLKNYLIPESNFSPLINLQMRLNMISFGLIISLSLVFCLTTD